MSVTAEHISKLRRLVNEPDSSTYDDDTLTTIIETCALPDSKGRYPEHQDWDGSYDLNRAAADVWAEKAALHAGKYDMSADGARLQRSQLTQHCQRMSSFFKSRSAIAGIRSTPIVEIDSGEDEDDA